MYRAVQSPSGFNFRVETKVPTLGSLLIRLISRRYPLKYQWIPVKFYEDQYAFFREFSSLEKANKFVEKMKAADIDKNENWKEVCG